MSAYRSIGTAVLVNNNGTPFTRTIPKPAGLAVGDKMVAILAVSDNGAQQAVSGWASLGGLGANSNTGLYCYGKTADAGDVAASDFTFVPVSGNGGADDVIGGVVIAISGTIPNTGTEFVDFGTDTDNLSTTQLYTGGVDPRVANCILIMAAFASGTSPGAIGSYAIAVSDPTWTERFEDAEGSTSPDYLFGVATAPRAQTTPTGDFSVVLDTASVNSIGVLIAVIEQQDGSAAPTIVQLTAQPQTPAASGGAVASPSVVQLTTTAIAPTATAVAAEWTPADKPDDDDADWTATDKP